MNVGKDLSYVILTEVMVENRTGMLREKRDPVLHYRVGVMILDTIFWQLLGHSQGRHKKQTDMVLWHI